MENNLNNISETNALETSALETSALETSASRKIMAHRLKTNAFKKFKFNINRRLILNMLNAFLSALLGGIAFSIGTIAFLSVNNKNVGSAIFTLGIIIIFAYGFGFYTSKIGYSFKSTKEQNFMLFPIWIGNLLGAMALGGIMTLTRSEISETLSSRANQLCGQKLADSVGGILILSIFCGLLMFVATDNFKNAKNNIQKYGVLILTSMVFLLSGFEHFVSNAFLFVVAGNINVKVIWYLIIMSFGNTIGTLIIPISHKSVKLIQRMAKK